MRDMIFLSHANPEDNEFTMWLALQLAREGYPIWCDLTKFLGGEDLWDTAEHAIRRRSSKLIYVLSRVSNKKSGPRKELQVATNVQREGRLKDFVIPVLVDDLPPNKFNIMVANLYATPFNRGWASGLKALLKKLDEDAVPKDKSRFSPKAVRQWWKTNFSAGMGVIERKEEYLSNWFEITMPHLLYFHRIREGVLAGDRFPQEFAYPVVRHDRYLVCFAESKDLVVAGRSVVEPGASFCVSVQTFMQGLDVPEFLGEKDAKNLLIMLLRTCWESFAERSGLLTYEMANRTKAFYGTGQLFGNKVLAFAGIGGKGRKSLIGYRTMRTAKGVKWKRYWHFAISAKPILWPRVAYAMRSHVVFSEDGMNAWTDSGRTHRARRGQCKRWWNDDWRDRILCIVHWLKGGGGNVCIKVGANASLEVSSWPVKLTSPVSYNEPKGRSTMSIIEQFERQEGRQEQIEESDEDGEWT